MKVTMGRIIPKCSKPPPRSYFTNLNSWAIKGDDFPKIIVIPGFGRTGFGRLAKSNGIPCKKWSFHSSLGDLSPHGTVGLPKGTMFTNKYADFMGFNSQIWWYNGIWPSQIMVILPTKMVNFIMGWSEIYLYNGIWWEYNMLQPTNRQESSINVVLNQPCCGM